MDYFSTHGSANEFFVLFHGTGGNEFSLLSVAGDIDPYASVISFLGEEGTGERRRFFQPLTDGKLNRENFNEKVTAFLKQWEEVKPQDAQTTFIGYSNGANFVLGLLEKNPAVADAVVLLHPSNLGYTFDSGSDVPIFVTAGATDNLVPPGDVLQLTKQLQEKFPRTKMKLLDTGHEVTGEEVEFVAAFLEK